MKVTTTKAFKIVVYKTGINFGWTGVVKVGWKIVHDLDVYFTRQAAEEAAARWIAKQ